MKKMNEKLKNLYNNNKVKILIKILIWLFIINEFYNIYIDIYNFRQLEKAKIILEKIPRDDYSFYWLDKFNNKYNANIVPIKNCYYVRNRNWKYPYIFWMKLESITYKIIYLRFNYAYPKYDIPYSIWCMMWAGCKDISLSWFNRTISNPCEN